MKINEPCPLCGGKMMILGKTDDVPPIHTLLCTDCTAMWDVEVPTIQLKEAWANICKKQKYDWADIICKEEKNDN